MAWLTGCAWRLDPLTNIHSHALTVPLQLTRIGPPLLRLLLAGALGAHSTARIPDIADVIAAMLRSTSMQVGHVGCVCVLGMQVCGAALGGVSPEHAGALLRSTGMQVCGAALGACRGHAVLLTPPTPNTPTPSAPHPISPAGRAVAGVCSRPGAGRVCSPSGQADLPGHRCHHCGGAGGHIRGGEAGAYHNTAHCTF